MKKHQGLWNIVYLGREIHELLIRNEELEEDNAQLRADKEEWFQIAQEGEKVRGKVMLDMILLLDDKKVEALRQDSRQERSCE